MDDASALTLPWEQLKNSSPSPQPRFNNSAVSVQSWYVAARSRAVGVGQAKAFDLLNRRIVLYRDTAGSIHALDGQCSHLGANLGQGRVIGDQLECAFHHWRYGPDGMCCHAPGLDSVPERRLRVYPTQEIWGLIWIFNGPQPLFEMPETPANAGKRYSYWRLPPQYISCHPHLVIANGLDMPHLETLHDLIPSAPPRLLIDKPYRVTVELQGKPRSRWLQYLTGSRHHDLVASFTTIGSSLAWVSVTQPFHFYVLFSGRPSDRGGCYTQTIFFWPPGMVLPLLRGAAVMYTLLHHDRRILDELIFTPGFTDKDIGLTAFAALVNAMEVW
ncbi:MAG: hypothetical protein BroJett011_76910 [Chloroflexota bacterium]|nr:MAG: hypothetical protein BroJett011_76910 [Chloroflexota bacterium]